MTPNVGEPRSLRQQYQTVPNAIGVLVVEENTMFRAGLAAVLDAESGIFVAGEVADPTEAVDAVAIHRPDIVLLGVDSLCPNTERLAAEILDSGGRASVIVLGL